MSVNATETDGYLGAAPVQSSPSGISAEDSNSNSGSLSAAIGGDNPMSSPSLRFPDVNSIEPSRFVSAKTGKGLFSTNHGGGGSQQLVRQSPLTNSPIPTSANVIVNAKGSRAKTLSQNANREFLIDESNGSDMINLKVTTGPCKFNEYCDLQTTGIRSNAISDIAEDSPYTHYIRFITYNLLSQFKRTANLWFLFFATTQVRGPLP